jgi:hypothetical protein
MINWQKVREHILDLILKLEAKGLNEDVTKMRELLKQLNEEQG